MPWPSRRPRRAFSLVAGGLAAALVLAGCRLGGGGPSPSPAPSTPGGRPFTVLSTDPIRVVDPAAITDAASSIVALNVFQRLLTAQPGQSVLKPEAARDCIFTARTVYSCTLNKELAFHNGHPLTSSDVKFSIQRAARLAVPGSSASLLTSLRRIETPDPLTVRFVLSRTDTQFGWALASPAASIVDEEAYNADEISPATAPIVGSGSFSVAAYSTTELRLVRNPDYIGPRAARMAELTYRTAPDSATIEDAMNAGAADVVWRGLNAAAVARYSQQATLNPDRKAAGDYSLRTLPGTRVRQLVWSPQSRMRLNRPLRQAVAVALQGDRTSASVVPAGVPGHVPSFPVGGTARPEVTWGTRIQITLGYDSTMPDGRDIATQIRTRLEDTGGLSVRLRPDAPDADLTLVDRKAWTATALAWLQPYLDAPLPAVASTVNTVQMQFRATTDDVQAARLLVALQRQAALDAVVVPLTQSDEYLFTRAGVDVAELSFGPGWQLGLFGMKGD